MLIALRLIALLGSPFAAFSLFKLFFWFAEIETTYDGRMILAILALVFGPLFTIIFFNKANPWWH